MQSGGLKSTGQRKKGKHNHKKGATHRTISFTNNGSSLSELENCSSVEQQHGRENGGEEIYDNETTRRRRQRTIQVRTLV
jgi:hypothetical protein